MSTLHLMMPSKVEAIESTMRKLGPVIRRHLLDDESIVDVAIQEALANAVIHGNHQDGRKKVHVSCCFEPNGTLDLTVRDEGDGFDPAGVSDPRDAPNLLSGHGRGIFLMKALMDEVYFENGGTQVHMRKLPNASAAIRTRRPM